MLVISTSISTSRDTILVKAILQGNYSNYCTNSDIKKFSEDFFTDDKFTLEKLKMDANFTSLDNKTLRNILDYFNACLKGTIRIDTLNNIRTLNSEIRKAPDCSKFISKFNQLNFNCSLLEKDLPNLIFSSIELTKSTIKSVSTPDNRFSLDNTVTYEYLRTEIKDLLEITMALIHNRYDHSTTSEIQQKLITLIKNTQENLSVFEASNIRNIFSERYLGAKDTNSTCKRLFATECIFYDLEPYRKMQAIIDNQLPDTNRTGEILEKTAEQMFIFPSINHTSSTDIVKTNNVTHLTRDIDILASNDSAAPIQNHNNLPYAVELGTAVAHGIGNGMINGLTQHLSEYLNKRGYKGSKLKSISLIIVMTIAHSAYAASLPLIFASLQNKNPQDDEPINTLWETLIQQVMPTFTTNLVLSLGFQLLNSLQKNYLKNVPLFKNLVRSVPVLSTAYTVIQYPVSTAANMLSATVTSFGLSTVLNHCSSPKDRRAPLEISLPILLPNSNDSSSLNDTSSTSASDNNKEETNLLIESPSRRLNDIGEVGNTKNSNNKYYDVPRSTLSNNEGTENTYLKMDQCNINNANNNANTYDTPKNNKSIRESDENIYMSIKDLRDQEALKRSIQNRALPLLPCHEKNSTFFKSLVKEVPTRPMNTSYLSC